MGTTRTERKPDARHGRRERKSRDALSQQLGATQHFHTVAGVFQAELTFSHLAPTDTDTALRREGVTDPTHNDASLVGLDGPATPLDAYSRLLQRTLFADFVKRDSESWNTSTAALRERRPILDTRGSCPSRSKAHAPARSSDSFQAA